MPATATMTTAPQSQPVSAAQALTLFMNAGSGAATPDEWAQLRDAADRFRDDDVHAALASARVPLSLLLRKLPAADGASTNLITALRVTTRLAQTSLASFGTYAKQDATLVPQRGSLLRLCVHDDIDVTEAATDLVEELQTHPEGAGFVTMLWDHPLAWETWYAETLHRAFSLFVAARSLAYVQVEAVRRSALRVVETEMNIHNNTLDVGMHPATHRDTLPRSGVMDFRGNDDPEILAAQLSLLTTLLLNANSDMRLVVLHHPATWRVVASSPDAQAAHNMMDFLIWGEHVVPRLELVDVPSLVTLLRREDTSAATSEFLRFCLGDEAETLDAEAVAQNRAFVSGVGSSVELSAGMGQDGRFGLP